MSEADCPYCGRHNPEGAIACGHCCRDIGVPQSLLAEIAALQQKRNSLMAQIQEATLRLKAKAKRISD